MYSACPAYCIMYCPASTRMRNYYLYTYLVLDYSYLSLKPHTQPSLGFYTFLCQYDMTEPWL